MDMIILFFFMTTMLFFIVLYKKSENEVQLEDELWLKKQELMLQQRQHELEKKYKEIEEKRKQEHQHEEEKLQNRTYHVIPQVISIAIPKQSEANQHYRQFNKDFVIEKLALENENLKKQIKEKVTVEEESTTILPTFVGTPVSNITESSSNETPGYQPSSLPEDSINLSSSSWESSSLSSSNDDNSSSSTYSSSDSDYSGNGGDFGGGGSSSDW